MEISVPLQHNTLKGEIYLNGSKSISNRMLIINYVLDLKLEFENLSNSNDTQVLLNALNNLDSETIDIHNCGTAMRFLTALLSNLPGTRILTGDKRMQERPIKFLVDALKQLGADIEYIDKDGFPPLKINGKKLIGNKIKIDSSVSSQFVSALIMIAPLVDSDLDIELVGKKASYPYLKMTLELMSQFGLEYYWEENKIKITNSKFIANENIFNVEADWTSASYWYSSVALSNDADIKIYGLSKDSLQGDYLLAKIYSFFGVKTTFIENGIHLTKEKFMTELFMYDFSDTPDLAQTVAVTCAGLQIPCLLNGLDTLTIKETNRIEALAIELNKCGVRSLATKNSLQLLKFDFDNSVKKINTYNDHRMAMSFLPLSYKMPIIIEDSEVVNKSYPKFFADAESLGYLLHQ